jgi:glycosyltransferase involved in cell wall biosynthesis
MRILTALTYYRPHFSGLTIYAERLAKALVQRGHQVTVLTSRYDPKMPPHEKKDGVQIARPRVGLHISKGVIMPSMPYWAWKLVRQADIVHLHLPQLDAALIALIAWGYRKPIVLTYHCDLLLPQGFVNALANLASNFANHISAKLAQVIITNTRDYAENSAFLQQYLEKVQAIYPPVETETASPLDIEALRKKAHFQPGQRIISMVGRLASEKGVEYLAQALPIIIERHPKARVLYAGQFENVWGEQDYANRLAPLIEQLGERWQFLGVISEVEKNALFHLSDLVAVPSLNSTESFSITQAEAMTCGTPVVASDLPGVRQPILLTGMGIIAKPGDARALAEAINKVLSHHQHYRSKSADLHLLFSPGAIARQYENVFEGLLAHAR